MKIIVSVLSKYKTLMNKTKHTNKETHIVYGLEDS